MVITKIKSMHKSKILFINQKNCHSGSMLNHDKRFENEIKIYRANFQIKKVKGIKEMEQIDKIIDAYGDNPSAYHLVCYSPTMNDDYIDSIFKNRTAFPYSNNVLRKSSYRTKHLFDNFTDLTIEYFCSLDYIDLLILKHCITNVLWELRCEFKFYSFGVDIDAYTSRVTVNIVCQENKLNYIYESFKSGIVDVDGLYLESKQKTKMFLATIAVNPQNAEFINDIENCKRGIYD